MALTRLELIDALATGESEPDSWRVGTEYETFVFDGQGHGRLPHGAEGAVGIRDLLEAVAASDEWSLDRVGAEPVGALGAERSITLEPGGQFELSGAPLGGIRLMAEELTEHLARLRGLTERFGIRWVWAGTDPWTPLADIPWMPKPRYGVMRRYLPTRGALAHQMMQATCTVQANLDFSDQEDMGQKLRVASGVSSLVNALFANSPYREGKATGWLSTRQEIWSDTDPDRCGLLPWVFDGELPTYERYVDYALRVPLFFLIRDGGFVDCAGLVFQDFLARGFQGNEAQVEDWHLHLSTLFPDVRMKTYMEVRSADCVPPSLLPALPALWKGLLYDPDALAAAWDLVSPWSIHERMDHRDAACRLALDAPLPGASYPTGQLATELVRIARYGLDRQAAGGGEPSEAHYLDELETMAADGRTLAREALEKLGRFPALGKLQEHYLWPTQPRR